MQGKRSLGKIVLIIDIEIYEEEQILFLFLVLLQFCIKSVEVTESKETHISIYA